MSQFNEYPYTNYSDLNLDWLLKELTNVKNKLSDYLNLSVIHFADPLQWDITKQYPINTLTIDQSGNAYLSRQPVPVGVDIDNADYWAPVFNYVNDIDTIKENIASSNEKNKTTASQTRKVGDLVWVYNDLHRIIAPMIAGDQYTVGSNCEKVTIEELIKCVYTPAQELISFRGIIDGTAEITVSGDVHTYNMEEQAIKIERGVTNG